MSHCVENLAFPNSNEKKRQFIIGDEILHINNFKEGWSSVWIN